MKKLITSIIVLVLILTCALTVLTACREEIDYEHTIVFYSNQGSALKNITADVIKKFEEKYPGWKVEHDTSAGSWDGLPKLIVDDIGVGNQPDIAYCYPDHVATYMTTHSVVDLNKYFYSEEMFNGERLGFTEEEQDDFYDIFMYDGMADNFSDVTQYGYQDDALLSIPFIKSTEVLFYNKTALDWLVQTLKDKNDDRVDRFVDNSGAMIAPDTWGDLWAQCEVIKEYFPNVYPLTYDSEANWFITACAQNGWKYTDKNEEEHYPFRGQGGLENWLLDLYSKFSDKYFATRLTVDATGNTYTSKIFANGVGTIHDTVTDKDVKIDNGNGGGSIYCIGSSGGATYQDATSFNVGIAPIPGTKRANGNVYRDAIAQGPSFVMFRGGHGVTNADEKEKMTWLFMKMMLDAEQQVAFCESNGYIPSRKSSYDAPAGKNLDGEDWTFGERLAARPGVIAYAEDIARKMQEDGRFFVSPAFDGSSNARNCVENLMKQIFGGSGASIESIQLAIQHAYSDCGGKN